MCFFSQCFLIMAGGRQWFSSPLSHKDRLCFKGVGPKSACTGLGSSVAGVATCSLDRCCLGCPTNGHRRKGPRNRKAVIIALIHLDGRLHFGFLGVLCA